MNTLFKIYLFRIILFASMLFSIEAFSTHAAGMDISYECTFQGSTSDTYKVTLKFYRDCEGYVAPGNGTNPLLDLNYSSSCGNGSATLYQVGSAVNINPGCLSYCNGGSGLGIEQYTYEATITLSHCSNWVLSICESTRNDAISTIISPGQQDLCVEAMINNTIYCNNSPTFSQYPTPFVCAGNYYCYNNGAIEIDGDSLVYALVTPLNSNTGGTVNFIAPYSSTNPVGGGSTFDPVTGNLCITPPGILSGVLAIKVSEYRNGILIGSIIRDIQINVFNCGAITAPTLSEIDTISIVDINNVNSYTVEICPDGIQNINFDINTINSGTSSSGYEVDIIINTDNYGNEATWDITNSSGIIMASGGPYPSAANSYSSVECLPAGNYSFNWYDSWGDGWCCNYGNGGYIVSQSGNILTSGNPTGYAGSTSFNVSNGIPCTSGQSVVDMSWNNGIPGATYNITNNNTLNPTGTFNWTPTIADTAGSPYFFTVDVTNNACPTPGNFSFQYQIILNQFDGIVSPVITDVSCNGDNNGDISLSIIGTQGPYSYLWNTGQISQSISGLSAGAYNVLVTDFFGCANSQSITLNDPTAISTIISQNNISCNGLNDGSISLSILGGIPDYTINLPPYTLTLTGGANTYITPSILSAGIYYYTISDENGCALDSSITIIEPPLLTATDNVGPQCDTYTWIDGVTYTASNYTATETLINSAGCDSIITLDLTINNSTTTIDPQIACDTYTWIDGVTYTSSNNSATWTTTNTLGCNNVATLDLTINNSTTSTDPQIACDTYTWLDGITYTSSNNSATWTTTNAVGCNNVATLDLTINNSTTSTDPQIACDTYTWLDGITYTSSNNSATWTTTNAAGCDNIATLDLTINNSTSSIDPQVACASYTWLDGITYTSPNNSATWTTTNAVGCNNIATLDLTFSSITTSIDPQIACDTYTWLDGITYTSTNNSATWTTTDGAGCTNVATLDLTINNSTSSIDPQISCDTYTWLDGITYNSSNNSATWTTTNSVGCNNLATLDLTINNATSNTTIEDQCDTYTWLVNNQTYTNSGSYSDISINASGCAHTEVLNLIVGYSDEVDLLIAENHISCFGYNDGSIILTPNGGTPPFQYLWDNGSVNPNISEQSAGDYSFTFTDSHGCTLDSVATINQANQIFLDFIATSPICRYDESILSINISNSTSNIYTLSLQDSILKSFEIDTNGLLILVGVPITLSPNFSGKVNIVSLTDREGCTQIFNDDVHIEVKQLPQLAINEDDICEENPSFTLNKATPNGGFYSINNELTDYLDVENLGSGLYNIGYTYTDPISSCSNQINEIISINESPKAGMLFSPQPTDIDNPHIFFRDNSNAIVLYSEWDLGDGTIINDEINFWHTYADTGTYTIKYYITNMYECTDSVIKNLTINPIYATFIPDAFTPNNDGDNDYFYPSIIGGNSYNMKIYNRWGGIIYNEDDGTWDGKINSNAVEIGFYSYSILVNDFKNKPFIYTGIVNLIK